MGEGVFLGQLQAFLETARLGNVTRAADGLFLTQPALSSRLKRLEQEVGGALLIRDHKGARLTDAGRAFLPHAEKAVAVMTEAHRVVRDAQLGLTGDLVVATTQTINTYVLPLVITRFVTTHPSVRLSVHTAPSEEVLEMVLRGDAQLGLGRSLQHPDLESIPLFDEEFVLAVGAGHKMAESEGVAVADLAGETLITLFRSPTYRLYINALLRRSGLLPQNVIDLDNAETGKRLLKESVGVGLLPHTAIAHEVEAGTLRQLTIADMPPLRRTMVALRLRGAAEHTYVHEFLSFLGEQIGAMGLAPMPAKPVRRAGRRRSGSSDDT
jgi:DNA-binding transcriptional LysR family regulator